VPTDLQERLEKLSPAQRELVLQKLRAQRPEAIPPAPGPELPLSYAQQRLWFLHRLNEGGAAYNISGGIHLEGELDAAVLDRSFREVITRHESLRTTFPDGKVHVAREPQKPALRIRDLRHEPGAASGASRLAREEAGHVFDLAAGPLFRALLLRVAETRHTLIVTMHHIVSDGWSLALLIREVSALYAAHAAGRPSPLPPLKLQYSDFAYWQREALSGEVLNRQLNYWKQQLAGAPQLLNLPTDYPRPPAQSFEGAVHTDLLPRSLVDRLAAVGAANGATPFMTMLAAFAVLLSRYSGQEDLVIGSPVANRNRAEIESIIGLFVNTIVLRADLSGNPSFEEFLRRVRRTVLGAFSHQDTPFDLLVEKLQPERNLSHSPLFQTMFILQNAHSTVTGQYQDRYAELPGLAIAPLEPENRTAKFDLTLFLEETSDGLRALWEYSTGLFEADTIVRMAGHYRTLLESIAGNPAQTVGDLDIVSPEERSQLLTDLNATAVPYDETLCFNHLFEEQAAKTPNALAVVCGAQQLTYAELNARANRLANYLQAQGVARDSLIALYFERSPDLMVATLAILKAGAAYLPLDPVYPQARLSLMLADAEVKLVLTQQKLATRLPDGTQTLCLDRDWQQAAGCNDANPVSGAVPDDLAYVLYTSGSTGTPKGVEILHRGLTNYLRWAVDAYDVRKGNGAPVHSSISFDATITGWFTPLLAGKTVTLVPEGGEIEALGALLQSHDNFSLVKITPAHLEALSHLLPENAAACGAKAFVIGGEALFGKQLAFWQAHAPGTRMINEYGPTETVVGCCVYEAVPHRAHSGPVPIGRPIANTQLYVLDRRLQPVPLGVPGELYIGGHGVARGYRNRPALTAEKFIENPFGTGRLYRTGDLVKYLPDGNLVYLGRLDDQVKIRGFRIEPGEIEAILTQHPGVREAAILAENQRLIAYVVPSASGVCPTTDLRTFLSSRLPDYMVPAIFVPLAAMPLTPNGKVDRQALPAPPAPEPAASLAPRTPAEQTIAAIWAELLRLDAVGVEDNFFDLGGHSLLAIQLISRIRQSFGVEITPRSVFESPTVRSLARKLPNRSLSAARPPIVRVRGEAGVFPMSFAQQRLWFLDQLAPGTATYAIQAAVCLRGPLDSSAFIRAVEAVTGRHESLRTTFEMIDGRPSQVVHARAEIPLRTVDLEALPPDRQQSELRRLARESCELFDLMRGPLLRTSLLRLHADEQVLLLTMHHIVSDGWSMQLLIGELAGCYTSFTTGRDDPFPELPLQYADFAVWRQEWLTGAALELQLSYWTKQLADTPPLLNLPTDRPRPPEQSFRGARYSKDIPRGLQQQLHTVGKSVGATPFMTMLAAFQVLLARLCNQYDVVVATPFANRNHEESERLIGLVVNTLVLRGRPDPDAPFLEFLERMRDTTLDAQQHQDLPFDMLVDKLAPVRNLSYSPLFQVMFVWENTALYDPVQVPGLEITAVETEQTTAKFDLTLFLEESAGGLTAVWEYCTDLFDAETIARFASHFHVLLESIAADPSTPAGKLRMLTDGERRQLLIDWNATEESWDDRCFHELFAAQAQRTPRAIAAVFGDLSLTYAALNARANRLAHYLQAAGIGPEASVGLYCERSLELMVAVLGVLKAGAAYIPLDAAYPRERLTFMLEDARAELILTQENLAGHLPDGVARLCLDTEWHRIETQPENEPARVAGPDTLAYVLYTSGSTGKPKGAQILHRGLTNYLNWAVRAYHVAQGSGAPLHSSISFDATITSWFTPLLTGKTVTIVAAGNELDTLASLLQSEESFTLIKITPAHLEAFSQMLPAHAAARGARAFIIGGEALFGKQLEFWQQHAPGTRLINEYGPTETVVGCCVYEAAPDHAYAGAVPIGRPIANTQLYVLDGNLEPVPVGVPGELFIGGAGVARGYRNRPELTAQKFIPNPFGPGRLYRTADLVKYLPDGNLVYLGRLDDQVKIRGFRIELGEIEAVLTQHTEVREAAVAVIESQGHKTLVAYFVGSDTPPAAADLRDYMAGLLPDYMIPSQFIPLSAMPLTPNGKVDRKALPAPDAPASTAHVAPRTATEEILARIWREVLHIGDVGVHDNFFELGGDSIVGIQVVSRARAAGLDLTPRQVFRHQTIAGLASVASTADAAVLEEGRSTGDAPLTPIQVWFFEQNQPAPHHYNQSVLLDIAPDAPQEMLEAALQRVVLHHDALRLRFARGPEAWLQTHAEPHAVTEPRFAISQSALNITHGPVICMARLAPGRLLLAIHHLAVDAVSWRILLEDSSTAFEHLRRGETVRLPAKTGSFQSWAQTLAAAATSGVFESELSYWRGVQAGELPADLPPDGEPHDTVASVERVTLSLTRDRTLALLREAPAAYRTRIQELLVTALALACGPILIDLESHGRESPFDGIELSRTVGWFTAIYPVRLDLPSADPSDAIKAIAIKTIKERLRRVPSAGIGYGVLRYLARHSGLEHRAAIKFNYLGQVDDVVSENSLIRRVASDAADDDLSPLTRRSHAIDVTAAVLDGQFQVAWEYSSSRHPREYIEGLAVRFVESLESLIAHCQEVTGGDVEDLYPLSPMQQGMLFQTLLAPQSGVYVEQMRIRLDGSLDPRRFEEVWRQAVARHGSLRAEFRWKDIDGPVQILRGNVQIPWRWEDWRSLRADEQDARLDALIEDDRREGFDLTRAPLMRFALIRLADDAHQFVWSYHHLLLDGWSRHRVVKEVVDAYAGSAAPESAPPYRAYIDWLLRQDRPLAEAFWRDWLRGFSAPTPLTVDRPGAPAAAEVDAATGRFSFALSPDSGALLQRLARAHRLTLNTFVQAAWALLLSRYSGQTDIVFGATVSGRPAELPGVEDMVGLFINTLPVRVTVDEDQPLLPWLAAIQAQQMEANAFSHCSLVEIQSWSDVPRGLPLFESIVVFENYPAAGISLAAAGVSVSQARSFEQTNYPVVLVAAPGEPLTLVLEYNVARFDPDAIPRMGGHLQTLLSGMASGAGQRIADLPLLTAAESRQLAGWNGERVEYPQARGKCAHELFAEQAERTPDAIAVLSGDGRLTYRELNRRANRLAHYLRKQGIGPETIVGIAVERSLEMIVGILGIWKAGAAYAPFDPSYPKDRLAFMIRDSQTTLLLTQRKWLPELPSGVRTICVDMSPEADITQGESDENPSVDHAPENLAYLIYTSGSTGQPKGVLIQHDSCVDHCCTIIDLYGHGPASRVLLFVPLSFDQSVEDIFPPLLSGARLVLLPPGPPPSIHELLALIEREGVTMLHMPTAYWHEWTGVLDRFPAPQCLTKVKVGGELTPMEPFRVWSRKARPGLVFANGYGPTETTVTSHLYHSWDSLDASANSVPIGRALANTIACVLDARLRPVPVGIPGELYIGGVRVGRGYKDRPALTAERFVVNPFGPGRLYKTGDSVRYLPDGNLEFLGRIDRQVKIRGFRIEPGEIEALLNAHPAVRIAVVAARSAEVSQRLIAYVCPAGERVPDSELSSYLGARLPDYMVPSAYVWLQEMPLNPSGKIDRNALPAPVAADPVRRSVAPRDALEQQLAALWSEVLECWPGIDDNFFELGGHSLLAIRLMARIERATGWQLPLSVLFERPTIAGIAVHLRNSASVEWSPLVPIQPRGDKPPFFCIHGGGGNVLHYYGLSRELGPEQPFYALQAIGLDGRTEPLQSVEAMAERYTTLIRTVQPEGPYRLGGHSLGGHIAYAVAQRLLKAGDRVALVAVIDTFAPGGNAGLLGIGWDDARWMTELIEVIEQSLGVSLGVAYRLLEPLGPEAQLDLVNGKLRDAGVLPPGAGVELLRGLYRVFRANNQMVYEPASPIPVPVVLFRGADSTDTAVKPELRADPAWGWGAFSDGPVDVHFVPGDHIGMMTEPAVRMLAASLAREIGR
jgi:amino acid adenylation domain-containing protein/non-ribosomal peptide synthase protein (TIGR01720 family)